MQEHGDNGHVFAGGDNDGRPSTRDAALRAELAKVRGVNRVVNEIIDSLERSRTNMTTVHGSVRGRGWKMCQAG